MENSFFFVQAVFRPPAKIDRRSVKNSQKSKNVAAVAENYLFLTVTGRIF